MVDKRDILLKKIQEVRADNFDALALAVFQYQARHNLLYRDYLNLLKINPSTITRIEAIPFLPISFFKTHPVISQQLDKLPKTIFSSSGTTGKTTSRHYVRDLDFYKRNTVIGFEHFYGKVADYCVLGLLPSYLERSGSSLIAMVDHFIRLSKYPQSGFFLYDHEALVEVLKENQQQQIPTLLIGVSFALLDFAETHQLDLTNTIIMETGGMKGRRKEMTREELHGVLQPSFGVSAIHSEYGMTELLSQAYSRGNGIFYPMPTMKVLVREITDPLTTIPNGKTGVLNIIDLANLDSCAFVATDDLGRVASDGSFEILGRLDASDIRGCNLMVA